MNGVNAHVIRFQYPKCEREIKRTIGRLKRGDRVRGLLGGLGRGAVFRNFGAGACAIKGSSAKPAALTGSKDEQGRQRRFEEFAPLLVLR